MFLGHTGWSCLALAQVAPVGVGTQIKVTLGERKESKVEVGIEYRRGLKPKSFTFGGGARACSGRSANFSLSAAFRTCSSGTCRLTRSRKSRLDRGTFSPDTAGEEEEMSAASHPHSRVGPAICPPSPSATLSSRLQRVWKDFLSCSSTALVASNRPAAAARAACNSRLSARLLCGAGVPRSCGAAGFSLGATAGNGS